MPEISRFFGIIIGMFYSDHAPPHFHARYGGKQVVIDIDTLGIIEGSLPPRVLGLVAEWAALHQAELRQNWNLARQSKPLESIKPLE
jgi:hypothetical protein